MGKTEAGRRATCGVRWIAAATIGAISLAALAAASLVGLLPMLPLFFLCAGVACCVSGALPKGGRFSQTGGWMIVAGLFGIIGFTVALAAGWIDSTPDTPGNAVMEFLVARQLGEYDEASEMLCARLREDPNAVAHEVMNRLADEASVFGEGVIEQGDATAVVRLEAEFPESPRGREHWNANLVDENGWKVCGVRPVEP